MIDRVVKLDLRRDAVAGDASAGGGEAFLEAWTLPDGAWLVSEPTLVPKADGRAGDGVWVLCVGTRTVGDERVASELYKSGADFSFETGRGAT